MYRRLIVVAALAVLAALVANTATSSASFTTASSTSVRAATLPLSSDTVAARAGDGQTATAGTAVSIAPSVRVSDARGNPVSGVAVTFAVASGGGSVTGPTATTGDDGVAAAGAWTLGAAAGANTVTATAAGIPGSVSFSATGTAGAFTQWIVSVSDDSPVAGDSVTIVAQKADTYGNAVTGSGTSVVLSKNGTDGALSPTSSQSTNASGNVTGTLTTSTVAGTTYTVTADSYFLYVFDHKTGTSPAVTTVPGPATSMAATAGDGQSAVVGSTLPAAPSVRITDANGNPIAGAVVSFAVASGDSSVAGDIQTTDSLGTATVSGWTLGTVAGSTTLTATTESLPPVTFTATATAGKAARLVVGASDPTPAAGRSVTMSAQITDLHGNAVSATGLSVNWTRTAGTLSSTRTYTNSSGVATVTFTPSSTTAGTTNTVTASRTGLTSGSLALTVVAATPSSFAISAGNDQSATVGTALATAPTVLLRDAYGNAVSGATVTFAVASGGGSLDTGPAVTDASGYATASSWTLGTAAGANTLSASVSGLATLTFTATATAGPAAQLAVSASDSTPAAGGTVTVSAQLEDAYGNSVTTSGLAVGWTSTAGSLSAGSATTDSSGVASASFTPGDTKAGSTDTVTASRSGLTSGSATLTVVAAAASTVTIDQGNGQSATVNTAVATDPGVIVEDAYGNPVAGVTVTFAIAAGGGSVTGATQTTGADGVATAGGWTLGTAAGANRLTAAVGGLTAATFTATGTPGAATRLRGHHAGHHPEEGPQLRRDRSAGRPVRQRGERFGGHGHLDQERHEPEPVQLPDRHHHDYELERQGDRDREGRDQQQSDGHLHGGEQRPDQRLDLGHDVELTGGAR